MSARAFLDELRGRGVEVAAEGDLLRYRPRASITPELLDRLRAHKPSLLKLLEWEQRKLEQADWSGFVARPSRYPGYTSLYDPVHGEWHDFPTRDCFPSIVEEAKGRRRKGRTA